MGEDELVQEKPFLEKAVVCAAFVLRQVVLVFSPFGTTRGGHSSLNSQVEIQRNTACHRRVLGTGTAHTLARY